MIENNIGPRDLLRQLRDLSARVESGRGGVETQGQRLDFSAMLRSSIDQVNEAQQKAASLGRSYELGDPNVSVADVTIAMQKSSLAFQAALQVRNKLVAAYQEIMGMQL